jgi:DNA-binding CsgD family transcriptional regulator
MSPRRDKQGYSSNIGPRPCGADKLKETSRGFLESVADDLRFAPKHTCLDDIGRRSRSSTTPPECGRSKARGSVSRDRNDWPRRRADGGRGNERGRDRLHREPFRRRQVLGLLVDGKANKVIAHELGINPRTVEIYRANVRAKMQGKSVSELVRLALLADCSD